LLAHELCHVIGIGHPGDPNAAYTGDANTIAAPPKKQPIAGVVQTIPSSDTNTRRNLEILQRSDLRNPALLSSARRANWNPDPV
jgi:hypothetical protein